MNTNSATNYQHSIIEKKWQDYWTNKELFKADESLNKPKYYILEMFPYPSGRIHMGHLRNYALGDVAARFKRAEGYNVLHPMGWDAFGLPAENAAIQNKIHPATWTLQNIQAMKDQLKPLGFSYDWDREIATCFPNYYKHEQELFIDLYNAGLAYQKESTVNWDPVDCTVLANEQVIDGKGWRSGAHVERKYLKQWFFKITAFKDELLEDLKKLIHWPENVRIMQNNWIGKSNGAKILFSISGTDETIEVFTTRPDTIYGAAFIAIAYNHPVVKMINPSSQLNSFLEDCKKSSLAEENIEKNEKKGFNTGLYVLHPLDRNVLLPIYIANFVLMDYATGAIFGCPAHDKRDFEFAKKYSLPIKQVVKAIDNRQHNIELEPYLGDGVLINSEFLNNLTTKEAKEVIIKQLEVMKIGKEQINYRLKDWGVSRQRYWGCPIPIIHCPKCSIVPVPKDQLPVILPEDITFDQQGNPLDYHPTWKYVKCPNCFSDSIRETDTFDTFVESSWYFARFCSPNAAEPIDKEKCAYWLPVDQYIGGIEHAVMHLLYARFFTKALARFNYFNIVEPFNALLTQGMINHETYKDTNGNWLYPDEVKKYKSKFYQISTGAEISVGRIEKMSKSKKNVIDASNIISTYGADTIRLFLLSDSPPDRDLEWSDDGIDAAYRFILRLYNIVNEISVTQENKNQNINNDLSIEKLMHRTIYSVTDDLKQFHFNKAIARIRELTNTLSNRDISYKIKKQTIITILQLFNPIIPHITEECWQMLGFTKSLAESAWPSYNAKFLTDDTITIAVQLNGKIKTTVDICLDSSQSIVEDKVRNLANIKNIINNKVIKKIIFVPNKIINIVYE